MTSELIMPEVEPPLESEALVEAPISREVAKHLVRGTSTLGLGVFMERGFGFLANLLAARIGGISNFGAYSLAISTANNISTYAAGGIGSTAVRFSGRYSRETAGYATLSKVLLIVSTASASLGAIALWLGAYPIATLLHKTSLTGLLRWAALSVAGMIMLECCRGFLVGQRRFAALLLLSLTVGIGMILLLPLASRFGSIPMISSQGAIALGAVGLCLVLYRPLGLSPIASSGVPQAVRPMLKEVWSFGLIQLAGLVASNAAGWWLTTLIARSDTSMVQIGFFAIASQLRNMVGLAPALISESSLAVMADGEGGEEKTPDSVMAVCTFATTFASFLLAGIGIAIAPWILALLYGEHYAAASAVTALALATAVVHMGNAPASARLSIVSIRLTGLINTQWAILVAICGTLLLFHNGNAWKGAAIYFLAHIVSAGMVLFSLGRRKCTPPGMNQVFIAGTFFTVGLASLALVRYFHPEFAAILTVTIFTLLMTGSGTLFLLGKRYRWMPSWSSIHKLAQNRFSFQTGGLCG